MLKSIKSDTKFGNFPRKAYQRCPLFSSIYIPDFKKKKENPDHS